MTLHIEVTTMAPAIRTTVCSVSVYITEARPPEKRGEIYKEILMNLLS